MIARTFRTVQVGEQGFRFDVMIYGGELTDRQPLLILHSIEFPMPPSEDVCQMCWDAGLQVVFVRRPGYGSSSPMPAVMMTEATIASGATAMAEAAIILALIKKLDLKNIVLLAVGSSNPICYRLVHMISELEKVVFMNPAFNQDILPVFQPAWFRESLKQLVASKGGLHFAEMGLKLMMRNDPIEFYQSILKKSPGDMAYVNANVGDYEQAASLALQVPRGRLYYDAAMCLKPAPLLKDRYFLGLNAAILIGPETTDHWRTEMTKEAGRLDLPLYRTRTGDVFCAYASADDLIALIHDEMRAGLTRVG